MLLSGFALVVLSDLLPSQGHYLGKHQCAFIEENHSIYDCEPKLSIVNDSSSRGGAGMIF